MVGDKRGMRGDEWLGSRPDIASHRGCVGGDNSGRVVGCRNRPDLPEEALGDGGAVGLSAGNHWGKISPIARRNGSGLVGDDWQLDVARVLRRVST